MTDQHRDALRDMGLTEEQIDTALGTLNAYAEQKPRDERVDYDGGFDPFRVEQLEHENGIQTGPRSTQTAAEAFMGLNGFDEIGIAQAFGAPVGELRSDGVTLARALIFADRRRAGMKHDDAYEFAMRLTIESVTGYFTPEPKPEGAHAAASAEGNAPGA